MADIPYSRRQQGRLDDIATYSNHGRILERGQQGFFPASDRLTNSLNWPPKYALCMPGCSFLNCWRYKDVSGVYGDTYGHTMRKSIFAASKHALRLMANLSDRRRRKSHGR